MDKKLRLKLCKSLLNICFCEWRQLYDDICNCDDISNYCELCKKEILLVERILALKNEIKDCL